MRRFVVTATALLAIGGGCMGSERLEGPFDSLIPACNETMYAPKLKLENVHQVKEAELGLSYNVRERHCQGQDFSVVLAVREFANEADATYYLNNFLHVQSRTDYFVFDLELPEPTYSVDQFKSYGVNDLVGLTVLGQEFGFDEYEGLFQVWIMFRRGSYVGTYMSSARGPIDPIEEIVLADPHSEVIEALVNDTLRRWSLP